MENTFFESPFFALLIVVFFITPVWILIIDKFIFPFFSRREENQRLKQNHGEKSLAVCSYAREDKGYANVIKKEYETAGIKLVIDEDDLLVGEEWEDVIDDYIKRSGSFVYCISTNAKKSPNVKRELDVALPLSKERVQFIKPYRWNKRVTIPEEIAHINIKDIVIKVRRNKDGSKTYYRVHSFTLKSARAMKSSTIVGLLFLIFIIPTLAFWGIRELQKIIFTDEIKYEELLEKVPPTKIADNESKPNVDVTSKPPKISNPNNLEKRQTTLPPLTKTRISPKTSDLSTTLDCPQTNAPISPSNPDERAYINDFSVVGKNEHKAGERVMLKVDVENVVDGKIELTPFVTELNNIAINPEGTGQSFMSVTPDRTRDYLLEVTGRDGITACKKITVYISPNEVMSIATKVKPTIIKFNIQALPPKDLGKIIFFDESIGLRKEKREDLVMFGPRQYSSGGYVCFHIANAKRAVISSFGEIELGKEKCIEMPNQRSRTKLFEFELTVFGFDGSKLNKRIRLDMRAEKPEFKLISKKQLPSTKGKTNYELCFQAKNIKYIVLVTDRSKSQLLYLMPQNEKKICMRKRLDGSPKYLLILGINGEIYNSPYYDLNY